MTSSPHESDTVLPARTVNVWWDKHSKSWWWFAFSTATGGMTGSAATEMSANDAAYDWLGGLR